MITEALQTALAEFTQAELEQLAAYVLDGKCNAPSVTAWLDGLTPEERQAITTPVSTRKGYEVAYLQEDTGSLPTENNLLEDPTVQPTIGHIPGMVMVGGVGWIPGLGNPPPEPYVVEIPSIHAFAQVDCYYAFSIYHYLAYVSRDSEGKKKIKAAHFDFKIQKNVTYETYHKSHTNDTEFEFEDRVAAIGIDTCGDTKLTATIKFEHRGVMRTLVKEVYA